MKTRDLKTLLDLRYSANQWMLLWEVRNTTGFPRGQRERYADAVALHSYPSRGNELHGFELKVSRSDWTRELRDPTKPAVKQYCDRWWLVAPESLVRPAELPEGWGLLEADEFQLHVRHPAPELSPVQWPRSFVASLVRNALKS